MKKIYLFILVTICVATSQAQSISLLGYGGALTGSRVYPVSGDYRVKGDWSYGAALEFEVPFGSVTLGWSGQQTTLVKEGSFSATSKISDLNVNYYQLGFNKDLSDGAVRPHTIFSLGAAQFNPTGEHNLTGDKWFFAATFGLGLKADINEKVGLRIQAKGNMPLEMGGAGIFCTSGGCAPNLYFNPILFQGEFTLGLAIKLK
jgi:hypothetical protein